MKKTAFVLFMTLFASVIARAESANINWGGDVRLRHEFNSRDAGLPSAYHLHKLMARLGAKAKASDEADVEVRVTTGTGGQSTNQALGQSNYQNYSLGIDRAYFDYHGTGNYFHFYGGRMKNPFYLVGSNDLLFDSDLNLDGAAFSTEYEIAPGVSVVFNQGFFWFNNSSVQDAHLLSPQLGLRGKWDAFSLGLQGTFHNFDHMSGQTIASSTAKGNPTTAAAAGFVTHDSDYRVWSGGMEIGYDLTSDVPMALYGEYATNSAAASLKKAYIAGIKFGKFKDAGTWILLYDYRKLEKSSFIGAMVDGDCAAGGVDIKCHRVRGGYQWNKNIMTGVSVFLGKLNIATSETKYNRVHVDATFSF